jgi:hypothetical protein
MLNGQWMACWGQTFSQVAQYVHSAGAEKTRRSSEIDRAPVGQAETQVPHKSHLVASRIGNTIPSFVFIMVGIIDCSDASRCD